MAIKPAEMPKFDTVSFEEAMQKVWRQIASAFGLSYEQLSANYDRLHSGGVVRSAGLRAGEVPVILSRDYVIPTRLYNRWMREQVYTTRFKLPLAVTLTWIVGYNPQRLLEYKP